MVENKTRAACAVSSDTSFVRWLLSALLALSAIGAATAVRAQSTSADADPPSRVARLSEATGQVWLYSSDGNEWIAIGRNRPLTTGDRIATDNGSRAEISLGSTTVRVDGASELEFAAVDDNAFHLHLHGGSVATRLRSPQAVAEFTLSTDEGRFRAQSVGDFRFDRFDGQSELTVLAGQAVFEGRNSALPLTAGQHGRFWLDAGGVPQYAMSEVARDAFAAWNEERNRADLPPVATRYVSPEMTGADDLYRHGQWDQTPEYGAIWYPRAVAVDWAPYSTGHWAYVRPWGWTWVDEAPWGFAPFHYGRWVYHRNRWGWSPGTYVSRPVYAPALVAWMGGRRGGVSISIGSSGPPVGWFPLAPREVYVPGYRHSPRYVRNVNVTHVSNVTVINNIVNNVGGAADRRDFANRRYPHAVTVVPASVLTGRQPVAPVARRFRDDPQWRTLVADPRSGQAMHVAPVNAPPVVARPGRTPERPPVAIGGDARVARPGMPGFDPRRDGDRRDGDRRDGDRRDGDRRDGDRADRAGVPPAGVPPARPGVQPAPPTAAVPVPARPGSRGDDAAIGRPPRGTIGREPLRDAAATAPPAAVQPRVAQPADAPKSVAEPRPVQPLRRADDEPPRSDRRMIAPPPGKAIESPRPPRAVEAPRPVERARPMPSARAPEAPRPVESPRPTPPRPPEAARPVEAARAAQPARPPEAPRAAEARERREERRPERKDRKEDRQERGERSK